MSVYYLIYKNENELKKMLQKEKENKTPADFVSWIERQDSQFYVEGKIEPLSSAELKSLVL